ncbi:uncharacterized protein BBA_08637 [Beauveria bassiana ARSEF 2860]|uniref:Uncharacterized protein n=1 Tax=Beauveria bassiana (strain ARSEF 2860) TaxID=655819 RepID=J5JFL6_BEAB2|nr:uncharacterized protein BBA_08637 [Beauveria bassiana ARSEF 2860]EJP62416.1 hypothetical protein BBA_08637 [Beauveria bassiana ARSEF 2860]
MSASVIEGAPRAAIIAALEQQRNHGTMIPDRTGFTAAYDTIMNAVPEAQKQEAARAILQTIWTHKNNNNQGLATFKAWLEHNGLLMLFFYNELSQEDRYGPIVRDLQAKQAERHDALLEFEEYTDRELQIYGQTTPDAETFSENHSKSVDRIMEACLSARLNLDAARQFNERREYLSLGGDIGTDEPWFLVDIPHTTPLRPSMQVQVQNKLRGRSYYCGRHAGTYIFRLNQSNTVGDGKQGDFEFCGVVPRNRAHHIARLKELRGRVLQMLVATCSYIAGYAAVSCEKEMKARMDQVTDQDLESIFRYARIYLEQGWMFFKEIQEAFRESPVLWEFVNLMVMHRVKAEEIKEGQRLVDLICLVAKCTEGAMIKREKRHLSETAWHYLQFSVELSNCLVFHDNEVELLTGSPVDIHDYFAGEEFATDPNHPKAQYRITDEDWEKLRGDYLLTRSVKRRWTRDHLNASILADLRMPKADTSLLERLFLNTDGSQPLSSPSSTEPAEEQPSPVKRGRGRPKGSKNKPKPPGRPRQLAMNPPWSITRLFSRLSMLPAITSTIKPTPLPSTTLLLRPFSTTPISLARKSVPPAGGKSKTSSSTPKRKAKGKQTGLTESGRKVRTLKQNMFSPAPPPLRMGRQRHLRHWTIHRAWQLFRRQQHEAQHKERSRMQAGMWNACEALRTVHGPGDRGEGYLYRVAMDKEGLWDGHAIPIEYARMQTETPAVEAWNHEWKR